MSKRSLFALALAFVLGIGWILYEGWLFLLSGVLVAALWIREGFLLKMDPKKSRGFLLLLTVCFTAGACLGYGSLQKRQEGQQMLQEMTALRCQGKLIKKESKNGQTICQITQVRILDRGQWISSMPMILYLSDDEQSYMLDTMLQFEGKYAAFQTARNEGNLDEAAYYESLGFLGKVTDGRVTSASPPAIPWREGLYELRISWRKIFEEILPKEEAGVLSAVVLGDKTMLTGEIKSLYRECGIAHILAISGLHISVVGMLLYNKCRNLGMGFVAGSMIAAVPVFFFAVMTGMGSSVIRAMGMFFFYLLAQCLGEAYDAMTALGVMACFLLLQNPFYLQNTGFLYSFGTVLGVVNVSLPLQKKYELWQNQRRKDRYRGRYHKKHPAEKAAEGIAENLLFSGGIQLASFPMTAAFYYEIPVYGILLNLLVLPLMTPLLVCGLLGAIAGGFCLSLARILLYPCHVILYVYEVLCEFFRQLPGAVQIVGAPETRAILLYYLCLFFLVRCILSGHLKRLICMALMAVCLLYPKTGAWEIDVLDVGQGDGIFIHSREGINFFIDGGSSGVTSVGTYRILPFLKYKGIRRIDFWFLTHLDEDHISGFRECVDSGYPIKQLVLPEKLWEEEREADKLEDILAMAQEHQIRVIPMKQGDSCGTSSFTLKCVYPTESQEEGSNENSLVLLAYYENFRGVFTGDIAAEQEAWLTETLAKEIEQDHVVLLKAAHHGSNGSNSEIFLKACLPDLITVSCGAKNSYGHPGKEAMERMEKTGAEIFCTMDTGRIKVTVEKGKIFSDTFLDSGDT